MKCFVLLMLCSLVYVSPTAAEKPPARPGKSGTCAASCCALRAGNHRVMPEADKAADTYAHENFLLLL